MTMPDKYRLYQPDLSTRYVAICDVLGFKNKLNSMPLNALAERYLRLITCIRFTVDSSNTLFPDSNEKETLVDYAIFSDSCLIWSAPLSTEHEVINLGTVSCFFDTCNQMILMGLRFDMPFRIGISYGEVCIDPNKNLYLGKPIADAFLLEESQKWIGGACHPDCEKSSSFRRVEEWRDVVNYSVPTSNGRQNMLALNWTRGICDCPEEIQEAAKFTANPSYQKYSEALEFFSIISKNNLPMTRIECEGFKPTFNSTEDTKMKK